MEYFEALSAFARCSVEKSEAMSVLAKTADGSGSFQVTLPMFKVVLKQALNDELSFDELEFWASVLLQREDYQVEAIEGSLYALSEPYLMGGLDKAKIARLLALLD
ncbi:hypothetical protein [Pseudoalteromonas luteoviolacea]|uniref:Uncharacterized protein n=1 Tax=Pseudoalteromonas luteoviolacea NCIMB 1942 TaxID=1365253 RepID=A0A167BAY4_9GAMM|nr:hypothetical protein [Pseudoalteromonas luteoviolacea]KZN46326.1 hypothetical protein N482_12535 [Pseudoalteromonas luteoviolacea NCIMB 1942]